MKLIRRPSSTPLWRDEFAIHQADERYVNRRQFAKFLVLTSLGMVAGNVWIALRSLFHRDPVFEPRAISREVKPCGSAIPFWSNAPSGP